jgi:NADH-quinone oxidoreductase subunit N
MNNNFTNIIIFNNLLVIDSFVSIMKMFLVFSTFCCILSSLQYFKKENINYFEYVILLMFSTIGLMFFVSSYDLVSMYFALEVQSLSFYILASIKKDSAFSVESGLKYFIIGAFSSGLLLFGISLIYGLAGTTNFENLSKLFIGFNCLTSLDGLNFFINSLENRLVLGIIFILVGLLFKLTAVPFHMWAPDVYEGAPTPVSMLFASVPKIGVFIMLIKICFFIFYDIIFLWQFICLICALLSIVIGTLATLNQYKIKRFLAYSSISHVGFLLLGLSVGTIEGIQSLLFYLILYTVMALNVWSIVLSLEIQDKNHKRLKYITDLQGLIQSNPVLGYFFLINMFSMSGIPPLAGFFSKAYIFFAALEGSLNILVIIGILFSIISAFYYIRFIKIIFFDTSNNPGSNTKLPKLY